MRDHNTTFMLKASWNLCSPPNSLWRTLIRTKYNTGNDSFPKIDPKKTSSNFWRGISSNWVKFMSNLKWQIGNDETIHLWEDCWDVNEKPLTNLLIQPLDNNFCQRRASDFINGNGNWDISVLREFLPEHVVVKIQILPPPRIIDPNDSFFWKPTADGVFSTKSTYLAIKHTSNNSSTCDFDLAWKFPGPSEHSPHQFGKSKTPPC